MKRFVLLPAIVLIILGWAGGPGITHAQGGEPVLRDQIDFYLNSLVESGFSGAVLVARDGEILLRKGYGLAYDAQQRQVTPDTVFLFGSITKQFTAAAILHLEMQGLLNTQDRISEYLDAVPADKAGITIHQLLSHSSGLRKHVFGNDFLEITREAAVSRILAPELLFEPAAGVSYSDDAYKLLAAIVEITSGQSWQSYLKDHLFQPAAMEDTGFFNNARWKDRSVANGYYNGRDQGSPAKWPGPYWALIGAGGVMTTVGDMYRWYIALQDHTVLPPQQVEKLWRPYASLTTRSSFAYGWIVVETQDRGTFVETTGAGSSHNAYFHSSLEDDLVVIVASNRINEPILSRLGLVERQETLYATQVGDALVESIYNEDFTTLPEFARPRAAPLRPTSWGLTAAGVTVAALLAITWIILRRRPSRF
jgi:CubicO group peptidase (beta-lactamase class C family)